MSRPLAKRTRTTAEQILPGAVSEAASLKQAAEQAAEQDRLRAILAGLFAKAQALVPDPPDPPTRSACRKSPEDEVVTEKFRKQGFQL